MTKSSEQTSRRGDGVKTRGQFKTGKMNVARGGRVPPGKALSQTPNRGPKPPLQTASKKQTAPQTTKSSVKRQKTVKAATASDGEQGQGGEVEEGTEFNSAFTFDFEGESMSRVIPQQTSQPTAKDAKVICMERFDAKIAQMAQHRNKYRAGVSDAEEEEENEEDEDEDDSDSDESMEESQEALSETESMTSAVDDPLAPSEYFDRSGRIPGETEVADMAFADLKLSRAVLKGVTAMGLTRPTRIQAAAIPPALQGRDICGGAVTGSGKTLAFLLPVLERLQYRSRHEAATRVLVLLPTRELAQQCYDVAARLGSFSDVTVALVAGGLPMRPQEAELRRRPDIVIATPGRLIDHLENTPQFSLDAVDILVLDEADRMLEDGFADELERIVAACPVSATRQTLLFSASMTENVQDLVRLSMRNPLQLFVDDRGALARNLAQEFVRIRETREADRVAVVMALCVRSFTSGCIVFVPTRELCRRLRIMLGLAGLSAAALHGDLSQMERQDALERFRQGTVSFLVATDVAARGLDIAGVRVVLNYAMPADYRQYLHRVGRTARAGRAGRSVTLIGERDRRVLKLVLKHADVKPKQRLIDVAVVSVFRDRVTAMAADVERLQEEEKADRLLMQAEREATRAQNLIEHAQEIRARPQKQWFQTPQQKADSRRRESRKN